MDNWKLTTTEGPDGVEMEVENLFTNQSVILTIPYGEWEDPEKRVGYFRDACDIIKQYIVTN